MRDYAELLLLINEALYEGADCQGCCAQYEVYKPNGKCLLEHAADAIEELQAKNDKQTMMIRKRSERIEELLAAVPQWVSVEERLPERYKPVLVSYIGYNTNSLLSDMVAYRDGDGDWCWWDGEFPSGELCKVKITHWMPLPEPPKGVE